MSILGSNDESWAASLEWADVLARRVADKYLAWRVCPNNQTKQVLDQAADEYKRHLWCEDDPKQ